MLTRKTKQDLEDYVWEDRLQSCMELAKDHVMDGFGISSVEIYL
jgi:hypothetical protein